MRLRTIIVPFCAVILAIGCAGPDARYGNNDSRYGSVRSNDGYYGIIDSIESVTAANDRNALAGAVVGGVVGGVVGHQVGSGRGNDVATVTGAVGGTVVGHEIGKARGPQDVYRIRVRFDDGNYQTVTQAGLDGLRVGDSVRTEGDRVHRY